MDMYDRIEAQIENKHISRRQLAKEVGIPPTTLNSAFARKSKSLSLEAIGNIARALDVPSNYLLGVKPFDNVPFLNEHKSFMLKTIADTEAFKKMFPEVLIDDFNDNAYYFLVDFFVSDILLSETKVVVFFKKTIVDLNGLVDVENTPPKHRNIIERALYQHAVSETSDIENAMIEAVKESNHTLDQLTTLIVEALSDLPEGEKQRVLDFIEFQKQQTHKSEGGDIE